jgi:HAD superfamily hydrolase (TIGR01509 family)
MLKALLFDVDGTLADTEEAHRRAFNGAFREAGLGWHWHPTLYARLLAIAGGKERLLHYWRVVDPETADGSRVTDILDAVHAIKTRHYEQLVGDGQVPLRPGILRLIAEARTNGVMLALATTTTPANVDALLRVPLGRTWPALFEAVCDGATPGAKKPAPDVYLTLLAKLGLQPNECLAIEDSENGLRAARAAGIPTVVTSTAWTRDQSFDKALAVLSELHDHIDLAALRHWQTQNNSTLGDCHDLAPPPHPDTIPDRRTAPLPARQR